MRTRPEAPHRRRIHYRNAHQLVTRLLVSGSQPQLLALEREREREKQPNSQSIKMGRNFITVNNRKRSKASRQAQYQLCTIPGQ